MRKLLVVISLFYVLLAQARIGDWESFTSTLNVNETIQYENELISATDGGLLVYSLDRETFATLSNIDGLVGTKINCLELSDSGELWIGGKEPNGFIQIYNINDQESIAEFDYDMTEILDIAISDSTVYAIYRSNNDFGIIEFEYFNGEFIHKDLYPNWPSNSEMNNIIIYNQKVYVGTEIGLYVGDLGTDPNTWGLFLEDIDKKIQSINLLNNLLYFYSEGILHLIDLNDNSHSEIDHELGDTVSQVYILENGNIYYLTDSDIKYFTNDSNYSIELIDKTINSIGKYDGINPVFATNTGIAMLSTQSSLEYKIPNSIHQNDPQAITVLSDGRIVAAGNKGISIKESSGWRNIVESNNEVALQLNKDYNYFIADSIPVDFGVTVSRILQGPDEKLYCSIEGTYPKRNGGGVLIIDVDDPANYTLIDTTILDYFANDYMVVKDIEFDRNGNLWVADAFATNKHQPLHVRSISDEWLSYNIDSFSSKVGLTPNTIAIDSWQRVWFGQFQDDGINSGFANGGLSMLSYEGDAWNAESFNWYRLKLSNIDINETIWSLAISEENRMYVLTPMGLTFADLQFSDDDPIKYESPRYYFPNISFGQDSEIRLDARDNAWTISGSDGIHVLLNNSTFWPDENDNLEVESINTDNYPLLSNNVSDIAFDDRKGIAYIATANGINSFRIPFANSKENFSNIRVFPSPFHVPTNEPLTIDNLKDNSSMKVMSIDGRVIRSLQDSELGAHGYQIKWDGRDENGNWVNSGVYLIAVYTEGGTSEFTKVAIVRH